MWFNNALIYHYNFDAEDVLIAGLENEKLKACPPHSRFIYGWLPVVGDELALEPAGTSLICLGKEERILPRGVIKKFLDERVSQLETAQGRNLKKAEKSQLAEDIEFELLPKSFCVQRRLLALLDTHTQRIIINTSSSNQANQLLSLFRKSISSATFEPLTSDRNLALTFAEWITNPASIPSAFQLGTDCALFSPDDDKKRFNCKGYELPADEVLSLLSQGLVVSELTLIWNERIQFTLTADLTFKRLKCLDYLMDDFKEISQLEEDLLQRDAEITLLCGEFRELTNALMTALTIKNPERIDKVLEEA